MLVFVVVWWNALDRPRLQSDVILSQVLFREGTIYFLVLFSTYSGIFSPEHSRLRHSLGLRVLNLVLGIVAPVSTICDNCETSLTRHFAGITYIRGHAVRICLPDRQSSPFVDFSPR